MQDGQNEEEVQSKISKTRGQTLCAKVHRRTIGEQEKIIFNANWQLTGRVTRH